MSPRRPVSPKRRRGEVRRRGSTLEEAILDAAWEVLTERGYPNFTYEAVAERAGTSRPVLYRRWPKRDDLLLGTLRRLYRSHPLVVPDTGSLRGDAIAFLRTADAGRKRMITLLSVQLVDHLRESGGNFAELRAQLHPEPHLSPFAQFVARAVHRGELADRPRSSRVIDLPFDLYRHEAFMTMRKVPDKTIVEIVDEVWLPLLK